MSRRTRHHSFRKIKRSLRRYIRRSVRSLRRSIRRSIRHGRKSHSAPQHVTIGADYAYPVTMDGFHSLDPRVTCVADINKFVGFALQRQHLFEKRTTPWEKSQWDDERLEAFRINLERTDRLYFIKYYEEEDEEDDNDTTRQFYMIARQNYDGKHIFVELIGRFNDAGFDSPHCAVIHVSENDHFFMKCIMPAN